MTETTEPQTSAADAAVFGPTPRWLRAGPAIVLVLVAWVFVPMAHLPTLDSLKLLVLLLAGFVLTAAALRTRPAGARDRAAGDLLFLGAATLCALALGLAVAAGPRGSLTGPLLALGALAGARLLAQGRGAEASTDSSAARTLARGAAVAAVGAALYAVVQAAGLDPAPWGERRDVVSTFGNTSFAAAFQAAALPLALLLAWRPSSRRDRWLGLAAAGGAALHLALAVSRIDLIAAAAGVLLLLACALWDGGRRRLASGVVVSGLLAAGVLATLFVTASSGGGPAWLGRSDTVAVRAHVWSAWLDMARELPLLLPTGIPFEDLYPPFRHADEYRISLGRTVSTPHNDVLLLATSLGLTGALIVLGGAVALFRRLRAGAASTSPERAALVGCLGALGVSALASSPLTLPATALLAALAGGSAIGLGTRRHAHAQARGPLAWRVDVALLVVLGLAIVPAFLAFRSDTFVAIGRQAIQEQDRASALDALDIAAAADAHAPDALYELGTLLLNVGEGEAAIEPLRAARRIRPNSMEARASLAGALLASGASGARDEAVALLEESLALCPWHPPLLVARAQLALSEDRAADAVIDLAEARRWLPDSAGLATLEIEAKLAAREPGAHEAAIAALAELIEKGDLPHLGRAVPALLRRDRGLLPALVAWGKRLVDENPDAAGALVAGAVEVEQEDIGFLEEGSGILRRAGRQKAADRLMGRALGLRAAKALRAGRYEAALRFAQKAAPRDPDPEHYLVAARALTRLREPLAAIEAIGSAIATGSVDPTAVRTDPILSALLPDEGLELLLARAEKRLDGRPDGGGR